MAGGEIMVGILFVALSGFQLRPALTDPRPVAFKWQVAFCVLGIVVGLVAVIVGLVRLAL